MVFGVSSIAYVLAYGRSPSLVPVPQGPTVIAAYSATWGPKEGTMCTPEWRGEDNGLWIARSVFSLPRRSPRHCPVSELILCIRGYTL